MKKDMLIYVYKIFITHIYIFNVNKGYLKNKPYLVVCFYHKYFKCKDINISRKHVATVTTYTKHNFFI